LLDIVGIVEAIEADVASNGVVPVVEGLFLGARPALLDFASLSFGQ
jgi:hypothetical protein